MSRGSALFIESRRAVGAAVRSTPMRVLRRASKLDNGGILFRASWRSSGRRQRGRAVPNSVRWSRRVARQTRDVVVVSGGGGQGSVSRACPARSRWHGEAAGEERGAREGAMRRGDSWPWRARRQTCDVAPMPLLSHQCVAGLDVVVHHSIHGAYVRAQGTKGRLGGKVAGARVERREGEQEGMSMAGMARVLPCLPSS